MTWIITAWYNPGKNWGRKATPGRKRMHLLSNPMKVYGTQKNSWQQERVAETEGAGSHTPASQQITRRSTVICEWQLLKTLTEEMQSSIYLPSPFQRSFHWFTVMSKITLSETVYDHDHAARLLWDGKNKYKLLGWVIIINGDDRCAQ